MRAWRSRLSCERSVLLGIWGLAAAGCLLGLSFRPATGASTGAGQQAIDLVRVLTTAALAVVLTLGPGLVLRSVSARHRPELGYVPLPGLVLLAATGGLAWALAPAISPRAVCFVVLAPILAWLLAYVLRSDQDELLEVEERRALLIVAAALGVAVGRALWSLGPSGELLGGTNFRTMEVGDRSDSRVSFGVVQLVAHGTSAYSALGHSYFQGYTFSDRGPLSGLASAPVVLLSGGRPPAANQSGPWSPFDSEGFMSYRLAMMTFASTAFLSLWTLVRRLIGERGALLALLLAATTPFLVHEIWFTWPKLLAASLVLLAATSLFGQRYWTAGLLVGAGYLAHPLALFSVPALGLLALWPPGAASPRHPRIGPTLRLLAGVAVGVLAWRLVNGSHYTQSDFLNFLTEAGKTNTMHAELAHRLGGPAVHVTLSEWVSDRLVSVGNTLVPLRLFFLSAGDQSINTAYQACFPFCRGGSPGIVHFFFQYWTTVPFGLGILFFPLLLQSLWRAIRRWPWAITATVVVPFLVFAIYWGDASTGMLREGLHVWVLTLIVVVAAEQQRRRFAWLRDLPVRFVLALRSVEVLLVAMLPTIVTRHQVLTRHFLLSDIVAVAAMLVLSAMLGVRVWRDSGLILGPGGLLRSSVR